MTFVDQQLGVKDEVTHNTPVTVDRFFEFESESITDSFGRTAGDPLRVGSYFERSDRWTGFYEGASGTIEMAMLSKGFGWWGKHLLGSSATTGPAETTVYTHTATQGPLVGDSFTCQITRPFNPSGTAQAFTYAGGKVTSWTISNDVDGNLMLSVDCDFASCATATATATASYPAGIVEPLTWAGGVVTIGGAATDITSFEVAVDNGLKTDSRYIRANTAKKEQVGDGKTGTFSFEADFDALTQRTRALAATTGAGQAQLIGTWSAPTLLGSTLFPKVVVTVDLGRFDTWEATNAGRGEAIMQSISGKIQYDGTDSGVTIAVSNGDTTA